MKIQLLSDLHLEAQPQWRARAAPNADILVLAGDIGSYQQGSHLSDPDFGLAQFSPAAGWPTPVLYVPGNHEYDAGDWDHLNARLQACCERLGLHWLERNSFTSAVSDRHGHAIRFLGTTLWSDFDALARSEFGASAERARAKAFRAANFYLKKTQTTRHGAPFLAEAMRDQGRVCQEWLALELAKPFAGTTVVVTHFAPSLHSADPRYGLTPGTAGFCNSLEPLMAQAQLWLHGHLHAPSDYTLHGCRVVANPLGYARKNEQVGFRDAHCLEI